MQPAWGKYQYFQYQGKWSDGNSKDKVQDVYEALKCDLE